LFEIALAAMDSEPVAEVLSNRPGNDTSTIDRALPVGTQLYRHAQQPVVPPMQHWEELCRQYPDMSIRDAIIRAAWWNHCRAAMLQAGNSPVIPNGYVMVPKEPTAEMIWAAKYCFTSTPGWDVFKSAYIAMLAAADCSIPMISDRWVPVSERMPERGDYLVTDGRDFDVQSFDGWQFIPGFVWEDAITHWMPLPATPQEVK
jgi:hypothetical protein